MNEKPTILTERNIALNFIKGVACIWVIFMHIVFPGMPGIIIHKLGQFAVPVFYMIAGYYSVNIKPEKLKKRLLKTSKILICAMLIYGIYPVIWVLKNGMLMKTIEQAISFKTIIDLLWFCYIDFASHLWYLIAMIEVYAIWFIVVKHNKENFFITFLPILIVARLILSTYVETNGLPWYFQVNCFTGALIWFLLGLYFKNKSIIGCSNSMCIVGILLGACIACLPNMIEIKIDISSIGLFIYSSFIFILGANNPYKSISKKIEYLGDKLSLYIYILHVIIAKILTVTLKRIIDINKLSFIFPILVAIVSIVCAKAIRKLLECKGSIG